MAECDRCEEARELLYVFQEMTRNRGIVDFKGVMPLVGLWLESDCPHAPLDTRWRPMWSAPRDGRSVEVLTAEGSRIAGNLGPGGWHTITGQVAYVNPLAWREAHPEWNEEPSND